MDRVSGERISKGVKEFRKEFKFHSNVSLNVTFQRFDSDWGEYVDLDEDCTLVHKDKLKAVVSPLLTTPSTDSCEVIMGVVPACAQSFKCKVVLPLPPWEKAAYV